jgi:hypothetical protein
MAQTSFWKYVVAHRRGALSPFRSCVNVVAAWVFLITAYPVLCTIALCGLVLVHPKYPESLLVFVLLVPGLLILGLVGSVVYTTWACVGLFRCCIRYIRDRRDAAFRKATTTVALVVFAIIMTAFGLVGVVVGPVLAMKYGDVPMSWLAQNPPQHVER